MSREMSGQMIVVETSNDAVDPGQDRLVRRCKERGPMEMPESITRRRRTASASWFAAMALLTGLVIAATPASAVAQFFDSGSTGVHGAFPPVPTGGMPTSFNAMVWNVRTGHVWYCSAYTGGTAVDACDNAPIAEAQIPNIPAQGVIDGVYHFTSFALQTVDGQHRALYVVGTSPNAPLSILSQTDITVAGTPNGYQVQLYVRGWDGRTPVSSAQNLAVFGGRGGPGSFDGGQSGNGGTPPGNGNPGIGPAGGQGGNASSITSAGLYGTAASAAGLNPSLTPLTGGSGGGGGAGVGPTPPSGCNATPTGYAGGSGGGGGGALLLAASNKVIVGTNATIWANGGGGGGSFAGCGYGAGGAGGSVRVVATEFTGPGTIHLFGGTQPGTGIQASGGFVRFESSFNTYNGTINGAAGGSFISFPTAAIPVVQPQIRITSINGTSAPTTPLASLVNPDISFATPINVPVTLNVAASNVPLGTTVNIRVAPAVGSPSTTASSGLDGTVANSTAQATVTLPPGAGIVTATATFNITGSPMALNSLPTIDGQRPQQMEVQMLADGTSKTFLIARSGARFEIGTARP
jgi:hypothetical protein